MPAGLWRPGLGALAGGEREVLPEKGLPTSTVEIRFSAASQAGPPGVRSPAEGTVEGQGANRARGPAPGKPRGLTGQEVDEGNIESTHCSKGTGVEGEPACLEDGQRGEEGFGAGTGRFWKRGALSGCWTS